MADYTKNKNLELPKSNEHYDVGVANKNNMVIDSELHKLDLKNQSQDNLLATKEALNEHLTNKNNPHNVTKSQIGLGNVDNTSDINKPVSTAQQTAIDEALYQSNCYTDTKIAELINGAPETLDTLKEVADAIEENETIVEALDAAIGAKANQSELDTHINNDVVHVTQTDKNNLDKAKAHADSQHARVDATKVEKSENNGNIIVDDEEINVYTPDILNTIQSVEQNNDVGKFVDALVIKEVFQFVSNGKELVACAITDKGVNTEATDTFQTMADNINSIQSGGNSTRLIKQKINCNLYFVANNESSVIYEFDVDIKKVIIKNLSMKCYKGNSNFYDRNIYFAVMGKKTFSEEAILYKNKSIISTSTSISNFADFEVNLDDYPKFDKITSLKVYTSSLSSTPTSYNYYASVTGDAEIYY